VFRVLESQQIRQLSFDNRQSTMKLQPRQQALLSAVIERYVETAEPVGSTALVSDDKVIARVGQVSSATVRNELAELESLGLLAHPHTSAGRVPTDAGYRVYVNELLKPRPVRAKERAHIQSQIAAPASSVEDALRDTCAALARLTGYPAVATLPSARRDCVRHVQLNPLPAAPPDFGAGGLLQAASSIAFSMSRKKQPQASWQRSSIFSISN
jgi:heat-inducible transcriptional repressor